MNRNLVGVTMMYTNGFAPMRVLPSQSSNKVVDIPQNAVVIHTGKVETNGIEYLEVEYKDRRGWIYRGYLDTYVENLPKDCVPSAIKTPNLYDADQYAVYNKAVQYRLCGQWCAAFVLGVPLETVLDTWQAKQPSFWRRVFGGGSGQGTTPADLVSMFKAFDMPAEDFDKVMTDLVLKRARYTLDKLKDLVERRYVIASVNIDGVSGRLRGAGVLHWVVLTKILPERTGGAVELYNPFFNRIEIYQWDVFTASARAPYGVVV